MAGDVVFAWETPPRERRDLLDGCPAVVSTKLGSICMLLSSTDSGDSEISFVVEDVGERG